MIHIISCNFSIDKIYSIYPDLGVFILDPDIMPYEVSEILSRPIFNSA